MPTWPKLLGAVGLVAGLIGGGWFGGDRSATDRVNRAWLEKDVAAKAAVIAAKNETILAQTAARREVEAIDHEHQTRDAAMRRRHDAAFDKLRAAYEAGCTAATEASAAGVGDGAADRDRLLSRIGESLKRRVVVPADTQAEQLLGCQDYVRRVCLK